MQMPDSRKGFIFGRRSSGSFDVRTLDGGKYPQAKAIRSSSL
jgi:hypothetical protein